MSSASSKIPVVILGAGAGGLAVGWFLARSGRFDVTLVEQAPAIGGLCASFKHNGFTLDHGPHKMYSVTPGILDELRRLMGDRLLTHQKRNRIWLKGRPLHYPLQLGNVARGLGLELCLRMALDYAWVSAANLFARSPAVSYADFIRRRFGRTAYQLVFEPLARKTWGDPETLHPEMARVRIPTANAAQLMLRILGIQRESAQTHAETFYYPRNGFGDFPQAMADEILRHGGKILLLTQVERLAFSGPEVSSVEVLTGSQRAVLPCRTLISSIPLTTLGQLVYGESHPEFTRAVAGLKFRHLILVYLFLRRSRVLEDHWIFFPEREFLFGRLFEQKQMNPELGPPTQTALCCDLTCSEGDPIWSATDPELASRCASDLARTRLIQPEEVGEFLVKRSPNFYPVYDLAYAEKMQAVSDHLRRVPNLLTTGRIGMHNYNNSDHCVDMGRFIAEGLLQNLAPSLIWQELEQRVSTYRIVD